MYYSIKMKLHTLLYILPSFILLSACNGVDRSGEQPFAPTVETLAAETAGDGVLLNGVGTSYGDTVRFQINK